MLWSLVRRCVLCVSGPYCHDHHHQPRSLPSKYRYYLFIKTYFKHTVMCLRCWLCFLHLKFLYLQMIIHFIMSMVYVVMIIICIYLIGYLKNGSSCWSKVGFILSFDSFNFQFDISMLFTYDCCHQTKQKHNSAHHDDLEITDAFEECWREHRLFDDHQTISRLTDMILL